MFILCFCYFEADDGPLYQHVAAADPRPKDPRPGSEFHGVSLFSFPLKNENAAPHSHPDHGLNLISALSSFTSSCHICSVSHHTTPQPGVYSKQQKCAFRKQDSWTRQQVKLNKTSSPLWKHAGFIVAQMDGLQAGVADWAKKKGKKV